MTILIDMDDVLECLVDAWVAGINKRFSRNAKPEDVTDWNVTMAFPGLTREQVYGITYEDDFWRTLKPMPGAYDALKRLMSDGHEVYIVTASEYQIIPVKIGEVLLSMYPFLDWQHVIITANKKMIKGDVLVDDGPHNLIDGDYRKILFDAYHNRNFDEKSIGAVRVHNWEEAYRVITNAAE